MSDSRLPAQICACGARVIEIGGVLRGHLNALLNCPSAQEAEQIIGEMKAVICGLTAEGNMIKVLTGAGMMAGMIEPTALPVETLELHPVNQDRTHDLFLASLHRAGDHTLDDEGALVQP